MMEEHLAEQATGCRAVIRNGGPLYTNNGERVSDARARAIVRQGGTVEAPNAGAGSYRAIAARLGFHKIEVENWSSSAGDWCFRLHGGRFLWQENRYPRCGFRYAVGFPC